MNQKPNILFIMTDDHAAHAMSCYDSRINKTPNMDRIAEEGMRFDHCYVTNSICTPSRAAILTGTYNHVNRVTTLSTHIDNRLPNVAKHLRQGGYQTAIFGKWHLGQGPKHEPTGFDSWAVLPGQGLYHDPEFIYPDGKRKESGYATDIITDKCLHWLDKRNAEQPFFLMCHHKAPHRRWEPDEKHARMYEDEDIPVPETFDDDYESRAKAAKVSKNTMFDLIDADLKVPVPDGLSREEEKQWRYQRYIKDYLRCIASVDDNIGRLLDYIDRDAELKNNTVIIYTSDQGFFLGDHGWFDKRFMYEESLKMPFIVRYPAMIKENSICDDIITNVDFAQTFLDLAGLPEPNYMQGRSFVPLLKGETPSDWPEAAYHRYWMNQDASHNIYAHYGIRTKRYKLIYYYNRDCGEEGGNPGTDEPEWELFDCHKDPLEIENRYGDPAYGDVVKELTRKLEEEMARIGDTPMH